MSGIGYPASAMGPQPRAYVERQLLAHLEHYGPASCP